MYSTVLLGLPYATSYCYVTQSHIERNLLCIIVVLEAIPSASTSTRTSYFVLQVQHSCPSTCIPWINRISYVYFLMLTPIENHSSLIGRNDVNEAKNAHQNCDERRVERTLWTFPIREPGIPTEYKYSMIRNRYIYSFKSHS